MIAATAANLFSIESERPSMIRKTLTTFGAALALTFGLVSSASATIANPGFVDNVFMNFGSGLSTVGFFGDTGYDDGYPYGYSAGTQVDDYFLYSSPPVSSQTDFVALANFDSNFVQTFMLTGFGFGVFDGPVSDSNGYFAGYNFDALPTDQSFLAKSGSALGGESRDFLDSGIYYIEIQGTVMKAGGSFSGEINTTPIPEPSNPLLMLAGLGLMGTLARRRMRRGSSR